MGVRRVFKSSGTLSSLGNTVITLIPQSNKKILIERVYLSYTTSSTTASRLINMYVQNYTMENGPQFSILSYSSSTTSATFVLGIAVHPLNNAFFTASAQLNYPLIISPNDVFVIYMAYGSSTTDSYFLLIEYLEMDLDEEIWQ